MKTLFTHFRRRIKYSSFPSTNTEIKVFGIGQDLKTAHFFTNLVSSFLVLPKIYDHDGINICDSNFCMRPKLVDEKSRV